MSRRFEKSLCSNDEVSKGCEKSLCSNDEVSRVCNNNNNNTLFGTKNAKKIKYGRVDGKNENALKKRGKINAGGRCREAAQFLLWKWSAYNQAALLAVSSCREFWLSNFTRNLHVLFHWNVRKRKIVAAVFLKIAVSAVSFYLKEKETANFSVRTFQ